MSSGSQEEKKSLTDSNTLKPPHLRPSLLSQPSLGIYTEADEHHLGLKARSERLKLSKSSVFGKTPAMEKSRGELTKTPSLPLYSLQNQPEVIRIPGQIGR